ncbi:glycosyltransferase family 1 protein [Clostridium estertheticum]|nr:glycosyltransferase family 1 protein [Clostridium estertheticum]WBL46734.1 glycosyltransferase family 1 protein [Clostridium estertheticum]
MENIKVIHGTMEIANQMHTITKALQGCNIEAKSVNYYPSYLDYKSDYNLNLFSIDINEADRLSKELAINLINENNIFHFHFGTSLTLDYSDLPILKNLNKKIFMQHWGSDVRLYSVASKYNPYVKVKATDEKEIINKLEFLGKYIDNCIVSDAELYEYVKNFYKNVYLIKQAIDIKEYTIKSKKINHELCIVHAPTSPEIKGTDSVLKVIEELKDKYSFNFKLVQGMSHSEARKIYEEADIIIDQLRIGSYGLLAIEAMAMGKTVITFISDPMKDKYPKQLPIISANPDTLKDTLEYLIINKDMLEKVGEDGRTFVERYHDSNLIAKNLLKLYKPLIITGLEKSS